MKYFTFATSSSMHNKFTIQLKAAFLLVVFSLNSIMGFGCSIGLKLGYNRSHHTETVDHCGVMQTQTPDSPVQDEDCCKDEVVKFTLLDKSVCTTIKVDAPAQFTLDVATAYFLEAWNAQHVSTSHYYVRSDHPPISTDIRIAIQSFQI